MIVPKAASTPSLATRPGTRSSCRRWSGSRFALPISPSPLQQPRGGPLSVGFVNRETLCGGVRRGEGASRPPGTVGPQRRPLSAAGPRRHQPLFALRRARHGTCQARRFCGAADAVGHLWRQDRSAVLQVRLHQWPRVQPIRLREPEDILQGRSRSFKFCALIFGGEERRFDETECAFFLHDTETIDDPGTLLSAGTR